MIKNKKKSVSLTEVNELLREYLFAVEDASRKRSGDGAINYPYATGILTSGLRSLVTLATAGKATAEEVRDALKYETRLLKCMN